MSAAGIEIIARALIINRNHILTVRRHGKSNVFLPGGHIEKGETAHAALQRELVEEIGLECTIGAFAGIVEHTFNSEHGITHEMNVVLSASHAALSAQTGVRAQEGHLDFSWLPCDQTVLHEHNLQPWVLQEWIPKYAQGDTTPVYLGTL